MAAIHDLTARIGAGRLRGRPATEWLRTTRACEFWCVQSPCLEIDRMETWQRLLLVREASRPDALFDGDD